MVWSPPPPKLCALCSLKVYPVEELNVDGALYHKACFRCSSCYKMLSLAEYASHRLEPPAVGFALFCKPHFKQAFLEHGRYTEMGASPMAAMSPRSMSGYKPSGITLFSNGDDDEPHPPPPVRMSSKTAADFESGFEPEYKPAEVKALPAKTCAKCGKKVFPVCKLEVDGSLYHMDCFRCATCAVHLLPASFALLDGATYCMQHAPKEAKFPVA